MSDFDLMEKAIKTGKRNEAKEILELIETREKEKQGFDSSPYIIAELKNRLRRDIYG